MTQSEWDQELFDQEQAIKTIGEEPHGAYTLVQTIMQNVARELPRTHPARHVLNVLEEALSDMFLGLNVDDAQLAHLNEIYKVTAEAVLEPQPAKDAGASTLISARSTLQCICVSRVIAATSNLAKAELELRNGTAANFWLDQVMGELKVARDAINEAYDETLAVRSLGVAKEGE